ncbi:hypothetical protein QFC21_006204 [Naganishia friedmannii]|uniref:Uncharacterized protein n=1 Tax=Naganishia friedmannii TaxID=89922 RepID=A0ACC2V422_9TREE|nr:hypothetical protein QFC21_006204 [Naganishia friedmannii]
MNVRSQVRTARKLRPITNFLGNQQFKRTLQRKLEQQTSKTCKTNKKSGIDGLYVVGPDYELARYERLVKAEAKEKGWKVPNKKELQRKAAKMRDTEACKQYRWIGDRVQGNLVRNAMDRLDAAVADFEVAIANDNFADNQDDPMNWADEARILGFMQGFMPSHDNVELLSEMYPGCFKEIPTNYSLHRIGIWKRFAQEERMLAEELLNYAAQPRQKHCSEMEWPRGKNHVTLVTLEDTAGTLIYGRHIGLIHANDVFSDAVEVYTRLKDINRAKINDLIRPTPADPGEEDLKHPSQDNGLHQQMIVEGEGEPDDVSASLKDRLRGDVGAEKCPSCFYKLTNEPFQKYDLMMTIDGNFSWKRLARVDQDYGRQYDDSALRIPTPIVDQHDEKVVQNGKKKAQHTDEQGEDSQERCSETKREVTKTISKHIEETGIVTLVCRHGVVWKYVDMVKAQQDFSPLAYCERFGERNSDRLRYRMHPQADLELKQDAQCRRERERY